MVADTISPSVAVYSCIAETSVAESYIDSVHHHGNWVHPSYRVVMLRGINHLFISSALFEKWLIS